MLTEISCFMKTRESKYRLIIDNKFDLYDRYDDFSIRLNAIKDLDRYRVAFFWVENSLTRTHPGLRAGYRVNPESIWKF